MGSAGCDLLFHCTAIVEPLSALFMMIVSWMISFFRACLCLYVGLSLGFSGICNVLSTPL